MKFTPKAIALTLTAVLGTLGTFLPFLGGMTLAAISRGSRTPPSAIFLVPFVVVLVLGILSLAVFKRVARWQGIVGALFSAGLVALLDGAAFHGKFKPAGFVTIFTEGNIGAKLVTIGAVGALVTCLIAAFAPDPK